MQLCKFCIWVISVFRQSQKIIGGDNVKLCQSDNKREPAFFMPKTQKGGIVHTEILLPEHAPPEYADRSTLWNAAEAVEKQWNAQLARRWVLTIPREIPSDRYAELVREFCRKQVVSKGMIADFALHDPDPPGHHPHAHVMLTMRAMDEDGKWLPKRRNVFEAVKQSVITREAASHYGIRAGRNAMVCCPFHNDKTPSMKLDHRYHCFGCGADGEMFVSLIAQRCGRKNIRDSLSKKKRTSYTEDDVQQSPIPSGLCG